jgi:hypothetical protein
MRRKASLTHRPRDIRILSLALINYVCQAVQLYVWSTSGHLVRRPIRRTSRAHLNQWNADRPSREEKNNNTARCSLSSPVSSTWTSNNEAQLGKNPTTDHDDTSDHSNTSDTTDSAASKHVDLPQEQYTPIHGRSSSSERRPDTFTRLRSRLEHLRWPFHKNRPSTARSSILHRSTDVLRRWTG